MHLMALFWMAPIVDGVDGAVVDQDEHVGAPRRVEHIVLRVERQLLEQVRVALGLVPRRVSAASDVGAVFDGTDRRHHAAMVGCVSATAR